MRLDVLYWSKVVRFPSREEQQRIKKFEGGGGWLMDARDNNQLETS